MGLFKEVSGINREQDRDGWLEWRRTHIGSSDITTICGLNPYQTPLELWAIKTGKMDDIEQSPAMRYGQLVEPAIIEIFKDLHPEYEVRANDSTFESTEVEWATATPDAILRENDSIIYGLLECKHTARFQDWDDGGAPNYAHLQLQFQLGVMGLSYGHIGAVVGGRVNDFKDLYFKFEPDIWDACLEMGADFMKAIQQDIPPKAGAGDSKALNTLLELREGEKELDDMHWLKTYTDLKRRLGVAKKRVERLDEKKKELENQIKQELGGLSAGLFPDGSRVSLKEVKVNPKSKPYSFIRFNFKEARNG